MSSHSNAEENKWKCVICLKTFTLKKAFKRDIQIHKGYGLRCGLCDNGSDDTFTCVGPSELIKHARYHQELGEVAELYNLITYPVGTPLPQKFKIKLYDIDPKDVPKKLEEIENAKSLQGPLKMFSLALRNQSKEIIHYNLEKLIPLRDQYTDRFIKCIEFIVKNQLQNLTATLNELYQFQKELCSRKALSDFTINRLRVSLNCPTSDLNFSVASQERFIRFGMKSYEYAVINFLKEEEFKYIVISENSVCLDYIRNEPIFEDCLFLDLNGEPCHSLKEWLNSIPNKHIFGIFEANGSGISIWKAITSMDKVKSEHTLLACIDVENSTALSKRKLTNLVKMIKSGDVIQENLFKAGKKVDLESFLRNELIASLKN